MNTVTNGFKNMALFWFENFYLVLKLRKPSVEPRNENHLTNPKFPAVPKVQYRIALKCDGYLPLKTGFKALLTVFSTSLEWSTEFLCGSFFGAENPDGQYLQILFEIDFCDNVYVRVNDRWEFLKKIPGSCAILALDLSENSVDCGLLRDCLKTCTSKKEIFSVAIRIPVAKCPARNGTLNVQSVLNVRKNPILSYKEEDGRSCDVKSSEKRMSKDCFWMYVRDELGLNDGKSISDGGTSCDSPRPSEFCFENPQQESSFLNEKNQKSSIGANLSAADKVQALQVALKRLNVSLKSQSDVTRDDLLLESDTKETKRPSRWISQSTRYISLLLAVELRYIECLNEFVLNGSSPSLKNFGPSVLSVPPLIKKLVRHLMKTLEDLKKETKSAVEDKPSDPQLQEPGRETVEEDTNQYCPDSGDSLKTQQQPDGNSMKIPFANEQPRSRSKLFGTWTNLAPPVDVDDPATSDGFVNDFISCPFYDDYSWSATLAKNVVDYLEEDEGIVA